MDLVYLDHSSWMTIDIVYCIIQVNLPQPLEFIKLKLHHIQKPYAVHLPKTFIPHPVVSCDSSIQWASTKKKSQTSLALKIGIFWCSGDTLDEMGWFSKPPFEDSVKTGTFPGHVYRHQRAGQWRRRSGRCVGHRRRCRRHVPGCGGDASTSCGVWRSNGVKDISADLSTLFGCGYSSDFGWLRIWGLRSFDPTKVCSHYIYIYIYNMSCLIRYSILWFDEE